MGVESAASQQAVVPDMDDVNLSDSELVYHVRNALKFALEGDCDSYNQLVGVMHHNRRLGPEEVALLVTCLKALSGAVSYINLSHHRSLLAAICGMSLWNYGTDVMDAWVELVLSLAASSGQCVDLCLDMLVSNFVPPQSFVDLLKEPRGLARKNQVLDRVHSTLKDIADLVPLSPMRLEKIVRQRMPHTHSPLAPELTVIYVENMFKLESGSLGGIVGSTMLVAIVDSLIDLDVEIAWDDILEEDFTKGIFDMELGDLEGLVDDDQQNDEFPKESWIQRFFGGEKITLKLDNLLVLTFEHLNSCYESGRLTQVFETLLQSFQRTVLTAYKSKFAQFVMFYACSLDPEYCGKRFASMLLDIFTNSIYPEWRMSAVAYLASYLSRAKFVSASFVATVLGSLVNWCSDYCKNQEADVNPKAHKVFYAGCQAIMYVLCFRMRSMILVPRLKSQLRLLHIEDILRHPLSPLKVCLPSIVEEFLRLVEATRLFPVPETSKADGMLESELSRAYGGAERLDMFFPFDPCLLKKSDSLIRPSFVYWSMVKRARDEEDNDSDEDASDGDVAEVCEAQNGTDVCNDDSRSFDEHEFGLDGFDYSLDKMSITPKDSFCRKFVGVHPRKQMPSRIRPSTSPESL